MVDEVGRKGGEKNTEGRTLALQAMPVRSPRDNVKIWRSSIAKQRLSVGLQDVVQQRQRHIALENR